jgi:hypothetical protein
MSKVVPYMIPRHRHNHHSKVTNRCSIIGNNLGHHSSYATTNNSLLCLRLMKLKWFLCLLHFALMELKIKSSLSSS